MSVAYAGIKGLAFYDAWRSYNGVTLLSPINGTGVWLLDMQGRYVNYWETGYRPGCYGELLPNGNLLYGAKLEGSPVSDLNGVGGILLELDWDGKVLWEYQDPYLHHAFCRMKNGNTLALKWIKMPENIARRVEGGDAGSERKGIMWSDAIQEINPQGEVVWEWIAYEHLEPETEPTCPICPRSTWPHTNACVELPNEDILTSFMKTNTIAIIDKKSSTIKWKWGPGELAHQHSPIMLDNGNILVFDNGYHQYGSDWGYSRVVEVSPDRNEIVWSYVAKGDTPIFFYSSIMSNCQRLPNGNTFICEGITGRLFEITPKGAMVWEYVNNLPLYESSPINTKHCPVYAAFRYGLDYPGLKRPFLIPDIRRALPKDELIVQDKDKAVRSRLEALGY